MKQTQAQQKKARQQELEATRKQQYEKSMKFTRYLYIRYFLAVLFFANIFWGMTLIVVSNMLAVLPITMLIIIFMTYFTIMKLQSNPEASTMRLEQFLKLNIGVTSAQIICIWINAHYFFPYMQASLTNQGIMTIVFSGSILLSLLSIRQISRIEKNEDKISRRLAELKEYNL